MTIIKQGAIIQGLCPMVDKTDFASVESGITSNFTLTLYTIKQGVSTAASAVTISRVPSVVHSGIIRWTLEAADTSGVDAALLKIAHASCADQHIPLNFAEQSVSDVVSKLTADVESYLSNAVSTLLVDTESYLSDADSKLTADVESYLSNYLSAVHSDLASAVGAVTASIDASDISDIASAVWGQKMDIHSTVSTMGSAFDVMTSSISDLLSRVTGPVATKSDVASAVWAEAIGSDINSKVGKLTSRITKETANASQLLLVKSMASDAHSAAITCQSFLSGMSNILSAVFVDTTDISNILSNTHADLAALSNIGSQILADTTGLAGTTKSDIASAVWVEKAYTMSAASRLDKYGGSTFGSVLVETQSLASDTHSVVLVNRSMISDIDSEVTLQKSTLSDIDSAITVTQSMVSDIESALDSQYAVLKSNISDVESALDSQFVVYTSDISDIISAIGGSLAELGIATPTPNPTIKEALMLLYMAYRNKTDTTSALLEVHDDIGSVICKAVLSDDGTTFTQAELQAGP